MPVHSVAYYGDTITGLGTLAALVDNFFYGSGTDGLVLPNDRRFSVVAAYGGGAGASAASQLESVQIQAMSQQLQGLPYVRPLDAYLAPTPNNTPIMVPWQDPIQLSCGERIALSAVTAAGAAVYSLLWLSDGIVPIPEGQARWLEISLASGSDPAVATGRWNPINFQFTAGLAPGTYGVIGFAVGYSQSTCHAVAARLNFQGSFYRPAMIACEHDKLPTLRAPSEIADGRLGLLGTFDRTSLPSLEVLVNATGTVDESELAGYVQVVYLGDCNKPTAAAR